MHKQPNCFLEIATVTHSRWHAHFTP